MTPTQHYLTIARRARASYGFFEFDPWEIVSFLWLRYRDAGERHTYSYLSGAVREYCNSERSKRKRALSGHQYRTDTTESPKADLDTGVSHAIVYPISSRPPSYDDLGRLLALGMKPGHIRKALGCNKVRVETMMRALRKHNDPAVIAA